MGPPALGEGRFFGGTNLTVAHPYLWGEDGGILWSAEALPHWRSCRVLLGSQ